MILKFKRININKQNTGRKDEKNLNRAPVKTGNNFKQSNKTIIGVTVKKTKKKII